MKNKLIHYLVFLAFTVLTLSPTIFSQQLVWKHLGGPMGGTIGDMAINSKGDIYAGVYGTLLFDSYYEGLYKSTNNGETWNKVETQFEDLQIYAVYITKEDHIFIGTDFQDIIYRSTDDGNTWEISASGFGSNQCWAFGENKGGTVLFAGSGGLPVISRSTNNGDSWQTVSMLSAISFATDSNNILYCGTFNGIYKSTDDGLSWNPTGLTGVPVNSILIDENNGVICGSGYYSNGQGVFYSADTGNTWTNIGLSGKIVLSLGFTNYGSFLAGTSIDGVYETTDLGNNWIQHNNGLYKKQAFRLKVNSNDDIFVGSEIEGIYRSTNRGDSFEEVGLPISRVNNIVFFGDSLIISATPSGVQKYNRLVGEWLNIGLHRVNVVDADESGNLLAGTNGEGLFQSTDFGKNWVNICQSPYILNVKKINETILAATDTGLIRSTNNGVNWESTPVRCGVDNNAIEVNNNGDVWAAGRMKLYKLTDNGLTFDSTKVIGFRYNDRNNLYVNGTNIFLGDLRVGNGIFYSNDYGITWQNKSHSRGNICVNGNNNYIIFANPEKMLFTLNNGFSWDSMSYPNNFYGVVSEIEFDNNVQLFFGTSSQGLYEMDFIVSVESEEPILNNFLFYPLYPNPFNSKVTVKFILPKDQNIKITIYNTLGERIKVLNVHGKSGTNYERISFDNLAGGIYLIAIEGEEFYAVQKAAFIK